MGEYFQTSGRWRGRLQFHLSTAVAMMLAASGVVWLNTLPVWHYVGEENGREVLEIVGYGWPCQVYTTSPSAAASWSPSAVAPNLLAGLILTAYVAALLEWRWISPKTWQCLVLGSATGAATGAFWFAVAWLTSLTPAVTEVSLSKGFKPGWQNWRSAVGVFLLAGVIMGLARWFDVVYGPMVQVRRGTQRDPAGQGAAHTEPKEDGPTP